MKTLLFGNGINIQYGGEENHNKNIILRAIENTKEDSFPKNIIVDEPELVVALLGMLFKEIKNALNGEYDKYAITDDEKKSLLDFKETYRNRKSLNVFGVGFEDYFLIYNLFMRKNKINNPERWVIRTTLQKIFIHSIYNNGNVDNIYTKYPKKFKGFFDDFENIFTTNYDRNIEKFTDKKVKYLHGAFHIKSNVYDENSLRNHLSDRPLDDIDINEDFYHLYSNVIIDYSGNNKLYKIKESSLANKAIEKFTKGYEGRVDIKEDIDEWEDSDNEIIQRLHESIMKKTKNKYLGFSENYPLKEFENIEGDLIILGLAPFNDIHIFNMINDNKKINKIIYFYYHKEDNKLIEKYLLNHNKIKYKNVRKLWEKYE